MDSQFKKNFSVLLAVIVGIGIVFIAWKGGFVSNNKISFEPTVAKNTWEESLRTVSQAHSSSPLILGGATNKTGATSTTSLLAREILTNYSLLQQDRATTTLSDTEAQAFAQTLLEKVTIPQGKTYAMKDIAVSNDNSNTALATYAKKVGDAVQTFSSQQPVNELTIVAAALTSKEETKLQGLASIIAAYEILQKNLLVIPTPSTVAPLHLRLVQSYANIEAMVVGMQKIISDPVLGLAALSQYNKEIAGLDTLASEYRNYTTVK